MIQIVSSNATIELNNTNQSFTTIYSNSNEGTLFSFSCAFNSDNLDLRLEIDGFEVFEINLDSLADFDNIPFGSFEFDATNDKFVFTSPKPLKWQSNLLIQARADSGSNSRECLGYWITIEEE
jgi:hypothetical protein